MKRISEMLKNHKIVKVIAIGTLLVIVCVGITIILGNIPNTNIVEVFGNTDKVIEGAKFITKEKVMEGASFFLK